MFVPARKLLLGYALMEELRHGGNYVRNATDPSAKVVPLNKNCSGMVNPREMLIPVEVAGALLSHSDAYRGEDCTLVVDRVEGQFLRGRVVHPMLDPMVDGASEQVDFIVRWGGGASPRA